ncbi:S8 family peptidase [Streptomyces sp. NPDC050145]|uniref:S8 family peptidase n=1 Tax=Streptomyces sp. NPDC050145 TaxID=3365602 RepID=UPI003797323F
MRRRAAGAAVLVAAVLGGVLPGTARGAGQEVTFSDPAATAQSGAATRRVTLVTGDVVHYASDRAGGGPRIERIVPGPGRSGMGFTRYHLDGHEYAVPIDAAGQIADGRVDRRLFDVTTLVADGYADDDSGTLRLVVGDASRVAGGPEAPEHATLAKEFKKTRTAVLKVPKKRAGDVWRELATASAAEEAGIGKVWLDGRVKATLDESVPQIGADEAHRRGVDGKGVKVAVLDTGYDTGHPDLKGRVAAEADFTGDGIQDRQGHGTHVSSTVAGTGVASGGRYAGVAPGADLLEGKVLDDSGYGYDSWILAGMEWAAAQDADIVSMSLGKSGASDGTDALSSAVDRLSAGDGPLFVIAAGNTGDRTIGAPGAADSALTVGSVTKQGGLSAFSSRGPRQGRWAVKPEISAPGSAIVAARAAGTLEDSAVSDRYASLSGTSMATPHVAGAAALLRQQHPDLSGQRLKAALVGSAAPVSGTTVDETGAGLVDVPAASAAQVTAEPATLAARATDSAVTRTVTWHNASDKPVTLTVGAHGDLIGVPDAKVTVPARADATTDVTLDLARAEAGRSYGGAVTAEAPGRGTVRVPVSITAPDDARTLTLTGPAPRPGTDATSTGVVLQNEKTGATTMTSLNGTTARKVSLPRGTYRLFGSVWEFDRVGRTTVASTAIHYAQRVTLDDDASATVRTDGAKPVRIGVDDDGVRTTTTGATGIGTSTPDGASTGLIAPSAAGPYKVEVVPTKTGETFDGMRFFAGTSWQQREIDAREPGGTPQELGLQLSQYSIYRWTGKITAEVVDIGTGSDADLAGKDLDGKIVLWRSSGSWETNNAIYRRLTDAGVALIMIRGYGVSVYEPTPLAQLNEESVPLLEDRLAEGPLTLTVEGVDTSPTAYFLFHHQDDTLPAGADWYDRRADLARVDTRENTHGYAYDPKNLYAWTTWRGVRLIQQTTRFLAPADQQVYVSPGVPWTMATFHYQFDVGEFPYPLGTQVTDPTTYTKGRTYKESWMAAPFNAELGSGRNVVRDGDKLRVDLPVFSDAAGHHSEYTPEADTGSTVLADDRGKVLDSNDRPGSAVFDLPRDDRWYRLTVDARRQARDEVTWTLGNRVTEEWRVRSHHERDASPLPLLDLAYDTPLDRLNTAEPDEEFGYAVTVGSQAGTRPGNVTSLKVSWSTDDGATWRAADARRDGDRWKVTVPAAGTAKVSLRTTVTDETGASLTETLIKAYNSGCTDIWCGMRAR